MKMAHTELVDVIHKHGLLVDPSDLENAYRDEEQGRLLDEWTKSHITRDTLLTKDELNACETPKLESSRRLSLTPS